MLDFSFTRSNLNKFGKLLYYLYTYAFMEILWKDITCHFLSLKWINVDYFKELRVSRYQGDYFK